MNTKSAIKEHYESKTIWQIIPDKFVNNSQNHYVSNALADMYTPIIRRFRREDNAVFMIPKFQCSWEILLTRKSIQTFIVLPRNYQDCIEKELSITWPQSTIKASEDYIDFTDPKCSQLTLKYHSCFGLNSAKNNDAPLDSIFECAKYMKEGDKALVQILLEPLTPQYYQDIIDNQAKFKAGTMPSKGFNAKYEVATALSNVSLELAGFFSELICSSQPSYDAKVLLPFKELSPQSLKKAQGRHFRSHIYLTAQGERRDTIVKSLYLAFRDMDNDNKLIPMDLKYCHVQQRTFSGDNDILCTAEVEKLIQLPSRKLQLSTPVDRVIIRENKLHRGFFDATGIPFTHYRYKGIDSTLYFPVKNANEACRTWVNIAPTGSGKSEKAANFAIEALKLGESVFILDPAQGTLCDSVRDGLPKDFPTDHIMDFNLGDYENPIPIHWIAKKNSARANANLMANNLIAYLNKVSSDDMGDRTRELLRGAAKVIFGQSMTLLEIKLMFRSKEFCMNTLKGVEDLRIVSQWEDYWSLKDGSQRQYSDPVVSRINTLMGDDFIGNSLLQQPKSTDIFRWLNGDLVNGKRVPYCVLLRMPKNDLGEEGLNAIATYWIYAIWLSVLQRNPMYTPISWLILDEPHQYLGSAIGGPKSIYGQITSEMRKWGLGCQMYFHSWEQIPKDVRAIFKGSGVNYSIFATDKEIFNELKEELAPFDLDDFLEMERFYCVNRILHDNSWHTFIGKCLEPAIDIKARRSWRCEYIDRSKLTARCHAIYGRKVSEVEQDIYQRESVLYKRRKGEESQN